LFVNYWHIANPILSGRKLKKPLQSLNILANKKSFKIRVAVHKSSFGAIVTKIFIDY